MRARWNGRAAKLWKSNLADNVLNVKFDEVRDTEISADAISLLGRNARVFTGSRKV